MWHSVASYDSAERAESLQTNDNGPFLTQHAVPLRRANVPVRLQPESFGSRGLAHSDDDEQQRCVGKIASGIAVVLGTSAQCTCRGVRPFKTPD